MIGIWTVKEAGPEALRNEARRVTGSVADGDEPLGLWTDTYDIKCPGIAQDVLQRVREVMGIVGEISQANSWPTDAEWPDRLPSWFVEACEPEDAKEEQDAPGQELSDEELRSRYFAEKWKLTEWTFWMEPRERVWMWWSAEARDADTVRVVVDRLGDPTPGDPPALWWLFSAAGATEIAEPEYANLSS